MKGTIFNIQRFSLHDGPGIRTTVFFKGCPLRCSWCHNPESFQRVIQVVFNKEKCIDSGICKGIRNTKTAKNCPSGAIETIGYEISVEELMKEISKDRGFFDRSGGGVTFSGGEPMMQTEFLERILKECKNAGIHTVVDTSGYTSIENFKMINELVDLYLFDLKHINDTLHSEYTGKSNKNILKNLKYLSDKGSKIFIRLPLIPGITNTQQNVSGTIEFLKNINFKKISLLSYHRYAENKYIKLKMDYSKPQKKGLGDTEIIEMIEKAGIQVELGG